MDSPNKSKSRSMNLFFLFLLFSSNVLTLFISTTFNSSCSLKFSRNTATTTAAVIVEPGPKQDSAVAFDDSQATADLPPEFLTFTSPQQLPFGFNTNFDSDKIIPLVGRPCTLFPDMLGKYMSYKVNGSCPDDELLAQKLLLKGCEPLPRRCRPAASQDYVEPYPLPDSFWSTPSDSSVVWTAYTFKDYSCLINRKHNQKGVQVIFYRSDHQIKEAKKEVSEHNLIHRDDKVSCRLLNSSRFVGKDNTKTGRDCIKCFYDPPPHSYEEEVQMQNRYQNHPKFSSCHGLLGRLDYVPPRLNYSNITFPYAFPYALDFIPDSFFSPTKF